MMDDITGVQENMQGCLDKNSQGSLHDNFSLYSCFCNGISTMTI